MPFIATYQRVYNDGNGGDDHSETKQDTFVLLESAISWIDAQIADGWAQGTTTTESTQVEITKTV